jgi:hypothetical protein
MNSIYFFFSRRIFATFPRPSTQRHCGGIHKPSHTLSPAPLWWNSRTFSRPPTQRHCGGIHKPSHALLHSATVEEFTNLVATERPPNNTFNCNLSVSMFYKRHENFFEYKLAVKTVQSVDHVRRPLYISSKNHVLMGDLILKIKDVSENCFVFIITRILFSAIRKQNIGNCQLGLLNEIFHEYDHRPPGGKKLQI